MAGSEDGGALGGQTKTIPPETDGAASHSLAVLDGRHREHWMWLRLGAASRRSRKDCLSPSRFARTLSVLTDEMEKEARFNCRFER